EQLAVVVGVLAGLLPASLGLARQVIHDTAERLLLLAHDALELLVVVGRRAGAGSVLFGILGSGAHWGGLRGRGFGEALPGNRESGGLPARAHKELGGD